MDDREIIATLTSARPDVVAIYRFGSYRSGTERAGSDIDLAVLARGAIEPAELWELGQRLATTLRRDVDLVDLTTASTVMKAQIIANGERLFCSDASYSDSYEDYILSSYAHLNEERRDILNDIVVRGSVYGF